MSYVGRLGRAAILAGLGLVAGCRVFEDKVVSKETKNGVTRIEHESGNINWKNGNLEFSDNKYNGIGTLDVYYCRGECEGGFIPARPCRDYYDEVLARNLMEAFRKSYREGSRHPRAIAVAEYDRTVVQFNGQEASK